MSRGDTPLSPWSSGDDPSLVSDRFVRSRRGIAALLAILLLFGTWLRFHQIERNSLWVDELFTLGIALYHPFVPADGEPWYRPIQVTQIQPGDSWWTVKLGEQSPPLHDLLAKASVGLFGPSELAARLPSALAACALLAVAVALAWRERDPHRRRILAWTSLVLACYPLLVLCAKDGRAYSLGASLVGIGALQWMLRWYDGARGWRPPDWRESLPLALACLTHYNAVPLVALLVLPDVVMAWRRRSARAAARFAGMAVIVLPWIVVHAQTILYTAEGGVAWGARTPWELATTAVANTGTALHGPFLALFATLLAVLAVRSRAHWSPGAPVVPPWARWTPDARMAAALLLLAVGSLVASGLLAAKAGMSGVRYYIFAIPLVAAAAGILFAQVRHRGLAALGAAALVLLSLPYMRPVLSVGEDYRSMARHATWELDRRTPILFPWAPNRITYRAAMQMMLGRDVLPQLVATSFRMDAPQACSELAAAPHVVVVGHGAHRAITDAVYQQCGHRWPYRYVQDYLSTYAEHWYAQAPAITPPR